jgi:fatty acid desaturase
MLGNSDFEKDQSDPSGTKRSKPDKPGTAPPVSQSAALKRPPPPSDTYFTLRSNLPARKFEAENNARRAHVPILLALGVHLAAFLLLAAVAWSLRHAPLLTVLLVPIAALVVSVGYRGLECLVHGAGHYDVLGIRRAALNDFISDLLFAAPVFQSVKAFRATHLGHHVQQGGAGDPCRGRKLMKLAPDRDELPTIWSVARRAPSEALAFYRQVGSSPITLLRAVGWHIAAFVLLGFAVGDWGAFTAAWCAVYLPAFLAVLPVVRALGEAGEHDYRTATLSDRGRSELQRTINNDGLLNWMLHPFGDHFHIEHHEFPGVPQYNLYRLHAALMENIPDYAVHAQCRTSVLGRPRRYAQKRPIRAGESIPANLNQPLEAL